MLGISLRKCLGLLALGAVAIAWLDLVPGDELIITLVAAPVINWGLLQNAETA